MACAEAYLPAGHWLQEAELVVAGVLLVWLGWHTLLPDVKQLVVVENICILTGMGCKRRLAARGGVGAKWPCPA